MPDLKHCPGLIHLRTVLRDMIQATGAETFRVYDGEDVIRYTASESDVVAASEYAAEVDEQVYYSIGKLTVCVIYDGPYDEDSAAEIVHDMNGTMMDYLDSKTYEKH